MYVRMLDGRDRGQVKDFNFVDAQDMLRAGLAEEIDITKLDEAGLAEEIDITKLNETQLQPIAETLETQMPPAEAESPANTTVPSKSANNGKKNQRRK